METLFVLLAVLGIVALVVTAALLLAACAVAAIEDVEHVLDVWAERWRRK